MCDSVCVIKRFSNRFSYSFYLIFTKSGTHDLCANIRKNFEQIFEILIFKFFGDFLKFYI